MTKVVVKNGNVDGALKKFKQKVAKSGKVDYRSIRFVANAGSTLKVYTNSSSKDTARTLLVVNVATGATIAELTAPVDSSVAGYAECKLPEKGEYAIYSAGSGINVYQVVIE